MDENGNPITLSDEQMQPDKPTDPGEQSTPPVDPPADPPADEPQDDNPPDEPPADPPADDQPDPPEDKPVSRRESKRIEQLLEKLQSQGQDPAQPREPKRDDKQIIPEGEYDIEQINKMAQDYGKGLYQEGLSQAQDMQNAAMFETRLEIDAPRVAEKYKFLDAESDDFNPGPAAFINQMYLQAVGYNPKTGVVRNNQLRYSEFVEGFMESVELVANVKVSETTKNVSKQASRTGIRPGGVSKPAYQGDDPRQMTDEQLEAAIAAGLGNR